MVQFDPTKKLLLAHTWRQERLRPLQGRGAEDFSGLFGHHQARGSALIPKLYVKQRRRETSIFSPKKSSFLSPLINRMREMPKKNNNLYSAGIIRQTALLVIT
jgi:hypothetical protein